METDVTLNPCMYLNSLGKRYRRAYTRSQNYLTSHTERILPERLEVMKKDLTDEYRSRLK
eukprot:12905556-Prorocentrum_lima.AAC.1